MIHPPSDANDAVVVLVGLDNRHRSYTPPRLPDGMPRVYTLEDLDLMTPGVKSQILHGLYSDKRLDYQWFTHPRQNVLNALGKGIKTMEYNRLPEVPILDRGNAVSTVLPGPGSPSIIPAGWGVSRNDLQPYPVYGWLELKWTDSEQRRGS